MKRGAGTPVEDREGEVMQSHEAADLIVEARATTVEEFLRRHTAAAFVVECFATPASADGGMETRVEIDHLMATIPPLRAGLHPEAQVYWIGDCDSRVPHSLFRLGRDNSSDIVVGHPRISRRHAIVHRVGGEPDCTWFIEDSSLNGTSVNGRQLVRGRMERLADGERIVLGAVVSVRAFLAPARFYELLRGAG